MRTPWAPGDERCVASIQHFCDTIVMQRQVTSTLHPSTEKLNIIQVYATKLHWRFLAYFK